MALKLGAQLLTYGASWDDAMETGRLLDRLGYDYLWGHDHLYSTGGDPYQPFFEGWTTLMAWAMTTERVRLGLLVGANTFRNPGVVAKMAATIDHASGGRSILGLGAGNVAFENLAHGIDPGETLGQRIDWFEESLAIIRDLLAGKEVTHHSDKYQFDHVRHAPQPDPATPPGGHRRRGREARPAPGGASCRHLAVVRRDRRSGAVQAQGPGAPRALRHGGARPRNDRADARLQVHHPLVGRRGREPSPMP